jgi:hypothetical protein
MTSSGPNLKVRVLQSIVFFVLVSVAFIANEAASAEPAKHWAVLIGCERYAKAPPLKFTLNDVRVLSTTLTSRGSYDPQNLLLMTDEESQSELQSVKKNLLTKIPEFFERISPGDSVLVYFTGHGFRDSSGKLYLAPLDVDPSDPASTGIAVEWLRQQIANCKASFKLLVLDACHAGSEKGEDDSKSASFGEKDLETFSSLEGVMTLASSTSEEKSQIWYEKQQSLFSYWLNQGIKGNADGDADGTVDFGELYKYVSENVTYTAKAHFPRSQTPVRVVRSGVIGEPSVMLLKPVSLREVLADNAELLANYVQDRKQSKVGVLEFTNSTSGIGELLGANYGTLGKWCTDEFERCLSQSGRGRFLLIDQRRMQGALKSEGFTIDDLGSEDGYRRLATRVGGMPLVAVGTLANRVGRLVTVKCQLLNVNNEKIGETVGTAQLSESEWAMLGRSVELRPEDRRIEHNETPNDGSTPRRLPVRPVSVTDTVIRRADERSRTIHPLKDQKFDFPITVKARSANRPNDQPQTRQFVFKTVGEGDSERQECFVPVRTGEVLEIWVGNRTGNKALMRLLVDGLNTSLEQENDKGIATYVVGKRVNLDEANPKVLDPADKLVTKIGGIPTWAVRGFVTEAGTRGKLREFTVVDADKSLAARQKFTDQIGIITAAFYAEGGGTRDVGIDAGREVSENLRQVDAKIGSLLSVVHIRYVDADTLSYAN